MLCTRAGERHLGTGARAWTGLDALAGNAGFAISGLQEKHLVS